MEAVITARLERGEPILRRELLAAGLADDVIVAQLRRGRWRRIRRGAYVDARAWARLDDDDRHVVAAAAVQRSLQHPAVLSHVSAAAVLRLPLPDVDLATVHVTRPRRGQSRREAGVAHHVAFLPDDQVVRRRGLELTRPDRTVLDVARALGLEIGVVVADAALRLNLATKDGLAELAVATADWPGSRRANDVVAVADGRSESPGESRLRVLCVVQGLPTPTPQVEIRSDGRVVARVDGLLEDDWTILEFDGRVKYGRERDGQGWDGPVGPDALWAEKLREDELRGLGYEVVRVTWRDLYQPAKTASRIRQAMARGRRRRIAA